MSSTIANGRYARTPDGKIDFSAYISKTGTIESNGLNVSVRIKDARTRYGHLDLWVTPVAGFGERWVEYKNINIEGDPGLEAEAPAPAGALKIAEVPVLSKASTVAESDTANVLAQVRALLAKTTIK